MPFYNRLNLLKNTLYSFQSLYKEREDWEVILPVDSKSQNLFQELIEVLKEFKFPINAFLINNDNCFCPPRLYNAGVKSSNGRFLLITNPEITHLTNVLAGLDEEFERNEESYILCSCQSEEAVSGWYQHSFYNNRMLHFCTAISIQGYKDLGGFDEDYSEGTSYDDDDFKQKILQKKKAIIFRDDLITFHQKHSRDHIYGNLHLVQRNKALYCKKWNLRQDQVNH